MSKPKSGRGRVRAGVLILVHVVIILHITHFHFTGRSVSPVEPSEAMYALELGHINAGLIFFVLAIAGTAIFGRFFCGWGCHIVALQDLCSHLLRNLESVSNRCVVGCLPCCVCGCLLHVFLADGAAALVGKSASCFTNHLMTENFWRTFPGPVVTLVTFVVCGGLIVYLLGNKGFCTYACPYGAFFYAADQVAPARIRVTDACQHCGQCTAACTSNVSVAKEVKEFGMVVDPGCMKCMDCVSVCPNDALYYGFKTSVESKEGYSRKNYDYSFAEDLVGLFVSVFAIFAMRGLYDVVPFYWPLHWREIRPYLVMQFRRVFQRNDFRIQQFQIKRNGKLTSLGRLVMIMMCVWFAFNIHSFLSSIIVSAGVSSSTR